MKRKLVILALLGILLGNKSYAQNDTTFWFAAPEVCVGNFSPFLDRPIRLVLSAYSSAATVTIRQPANPSFSPIVVNIPANGMQTVDLTAWLNIMENMPANVIHNRGLLIQATATITAYYEVVSPGNNPEIFPLKGHNALGTNFMIPAQNMFDNSFGYNTDPPRNSFDIVATENNTTVTIIPSQNIVGHTAGIAFNIVLNRGQTYSATASSNLAANHLSGSTVTSDKPIAITIKDDLVRPFNLPCADLMGDQLVPLNKLGTEHVLVRGQLNYPPTINNEDFFFVTATQNNTSITVNGTYATTINQGATYGAPFSGVSTFIQTDKPVYVIHVSGTGCEMAEALIPPVPCTGSTEVSFTRTSGQSFSLILFTSAGAANSFTINTPLSITAANFTPVPGSGGQWVAANILCSTTQVPVGQNIRVTNSTDLFHLGIINYGQAPGGSRYGYFSDYNQLNIVGQDSVNLCVGDSILLQSSGILNQYQWNTGDTTSSIYVSSPGYYTVSGSRGTCFFTDSVYVRLRSAQVDLGNDTIVCPNASVLLNQPGYTSYIWSNGATTPSVLIGDTGTFSLEITNNWGCRDQDSIHISNYSQPIVNLGPDTTICNNFSVLIGDAGFESYLWNTGDTIAFINSTTQGIYHLTVTDSNTCTDTDTLIINWHYANVNMGNDTSVCSGSNITLTASPGNFITYQWNTGDTISSITTTGPGIYSVSITDSWGCQGQDTLSLTWDPLPVFSLGNDTSLCPNLQLNLSVPGFNSYNWSTGATATGITTSGPGIYWLTVSNTFNCTSTDSVVIHWFTPPILNLGQDTMLCPGDSMQLSVTGFSSYSWNTGSVDASITLSTPGLYQLTATDSNNCIVVDSVDVIYIVLNPDLGPDVLLCHNDSVILILPGYNGYQWNTGQTSASVMVNQPGLYFVNVTDTNGCSASDSIIISQFPVIGFSLGNDTTICPGEAYSITGPSGFIQYTWNTGSTNASINILQPGNYILRVIDTNGCETSDTVVVFLSATPVITLADYIDCIADSLLLDAGPGNDSYLWNTGSQAQSITVNSGGLYIVTAILGNCSLVDTCSVSLVSPELINLGPDTVLCGSDSLLLSLPDLPGSFIWSDGSSENSLLINAAGQYWLSISSCGNSLTDTIDVSYGAAIGPLQIPDVFTPNGDNINDTYLITGFAEEPAIFELIIYNRWGVEVFSSTNYLDGWNGQIGSEAGADGTYFMVLHTESNCGEKLLEKNFITLLR